MNSIQTFDTLNIRLPLTLVNSCQEHKFKPYETTGGIQLLQLGAKDLKGTHGLNLVRINEPVGEVVLGMSSKLLGADYPKLLSYDTIPQALDRINATGLLRFDTAAAMAAAEPLLVHSAKDLALVRTVPEYTRLLHLLHVNTRYSVADFRNEKSLSWEKNVTTRKAQELAKLYDKAHEFELPKNKAFRESLAPADLASIRAQFRGRARFEGEWKTITKIRQYYGLAAGQPVKLSTLLASEKNPLSTMFDRITADIASQPEAMEIRLFMEELTEDETEIFGFCNAYGLDLEKVEAKYKALYKRKDTARKRIKAAKEVVSRFRAQQGNLKHGDFELLDELRHQLAA